MHPESFKGQGFRAHCQQVVCASICYRMSCWGVKLSIAGVSQWRCLKNRDVWIPDVWKKSTPARSPSFLEHKKDGKSKWTTIPQVGEYFCSHHCISHMMESSDHGSHPEREGKEKCAWSQRCCATDNPLHSCSPRSTQASAKAQGR